MNNLEIESKTEKPIEYTEIIVDGPAEAIKNILETDQGNSYEIF